MSNRPPNRTHPDPTRRNRRALYQPVLSASQRIRAIRLPGRPPPPHPARRNGSLPHNRAAQPRRFAGRRAGVIGLAALVMTLTVFLCAGVTLGVAMLYRSGILPGVSTGGIDLGGLSREEAAAQLQTTWRAVTLQDTTAPGGVRTWEADPAALGLALDITETVNRAHAQGRGEGSFFSTLAGVDVPPVVTVDVHALALGLEQYAEQINTTPVDAGVTFSEGRLQTVPPVYGRMVDIPATVGQAQGRGPEVLREGVLPLVMVRVAPAVTDASPMLEAAAQLLTQPFVIRAYDPRTGDIAEWPLAPEVWVSWLAAMPDPTRATGLAFTVKDAPVHAFLVTQSGVFDSSRYLDIDEAVAQVRDAVQAGNFRPTIRVYHHDRVHVVQAGESITSIAWDYGVPYPWLQQSNPGVESLYVGQELVIPSVDNFFDFPPVPDKRIVVSISQQRAWVYENGALLWEWTVSTGINDSPTWPGIYQILLHEPNAYAANWNLYMPHFLGVYRPIPNSEFTNGFHGFPTRGGGQILWENSLGRRVTYGCILLNNTNARSLYDWAEDGVVVEIRG